MVDRRIAPIRVLHVVGAMRRGGVETWLMQVFRHIDRERFRLDFLAEVGPGACEEEIRALGGEVTSANAHRLLRPGWYARNFAPFLRGRGPYDVVHVHAYQYGGYIVRLAREAGVPVRIAHSHQDFSPIRARINRPRRALAWAMKRLIARHATAGLAASRAAAADLFGQDWRRDPRWQVHHCGLDLGPFRTPVARNAARAEFGIPADARVIGHVGRFEEQKNHPFLVEVFGVAARRDPRLRLLLVGDGPLRPEVERQVVASGLAGRVAFAGSRPDVPRLMRGVMGLFLFPSRFEGLGLVLVEAQAAGLPCLCADSVPDEADVVGPLVRRLPLSASAETWADRIPALLGPAAVTRAEALRLVERSDFNIETEVRQLERFYLGKVAETAKTRPGIGGRSSAR